MHRGQGRMEDSLRHSLTQIAEMHRIVALQTLERCFCGAVYSGALHALFKWRTAAEQMREEILRANLRARVAEIETILANERVSRAELAYELQEFGMKRQLQLRAR